MEALIGNSDSLIAVPQSETPKERRMFSIVVSRPPSAPAAHVGEPVRACVSALVGRAR